MHTSLLLLLLAFAPPPVSAPETQPEPAEEPAEDEFEAIMARLDEADRAAANNIEPETLAELDAAIAATRGWEARFIDDERGRKDLLRARLNLARGYLNSGDPEAADRVLSELLRETPDIDIVWKVLSRKFSALELLFEERLEALEAEGKASLELVCITPCAISINSYPFEPGLRELYPGSYEVEIRDADEAVDPAERAATHEQALQLYAGDHESITFDATPPLERIRDILEAPAAPAPELIPEPAPDIPPARRRLNFTREGLGWAGISGLVVGAGAVISGAIAWSYDGTCIEGRSIDPEFCLNLYKSDVVGPVTVGIGAGVMLGSAVMVGLATRDGFRVGADKPRRPNSALVPSGLATLAAGAGLTVAGTFVWSYDGRCLGRRSDPPPCEQLYESATQGQIMLGVGAALLVTSATLLATGLNRKRNAERRPSVRVGPGPVLHF